MWACAEALRRDASRSRIAYMVDSAGRPDIAVALLFSITSGLLVVFCNTTNLEAMSGHTH